VDSDFAGNLITGKIAADEVLHRPLGAGGESGERRERVYRNRGWAFIEGHDSLNSEIYIVLKSTDRTYVFTTETVIREGVTQHFEESGLNLDYSGFAARIPTGEIASGEYTVGIYITKADIEALQYTGRVVEF